MSDKLNPKEVKEVKEPGKKVLYEEPVEEIKAGNFEREEDYR